MPPLSELPGEINRGRLLRALECCGFTVNMTGGKGSHCKIIWPPTQKSVSIQSNLPKQVLKYILKEIEQYSGVTWEEINKHL